MSFLAKIKKTISNLFSSSFDELDDLVNYIFSNESLPEPLPTKEEETYTHNQEHK